MASRFEIVDEGYIEDVKDKSENENMKKRSEYWRNFFEKVGEWKKLPSKFRRVRCATREISVTSENARDINPWFYSAYAITYTNWKCTSIKA